MKPFSLAAGFATLLLTSMPLFAAEVTTARGPVEIATQPAKIAVFDVAAIDTLNRLGVEMAGVPNKISVPELAGLSDKGEKVGTLFEPDLEALNALAPDLIIVGGRSAAKFDATTQVAPTIDMTISGAEDLVTLAKQRTATYGELFSKQDEASKANSELDAAIETARKAAEGKGNALLILTNGPKMSAYGPGSRFGWLFDAIGIEHAVKDIKVGNHGQPISSEFIRDANPDWLFVLDRAAAIGSSEARASATLDNELVAGTTAWKKGQVVYLPASEFYVSAGGIDSTRRVVDAVTKAYSEAK